MKALSALAAATILASFSAFGQGDVTPNSVVFEQLPLNNGALDADGAVVRWADDLQLSQTTLIRSVVWWGGNSNPMQSSSGNFSLTLYSDDGGKPGAVLPDFSVERIQAAATGETLNDYPQLRYVALLQQPFDLEGGARYWLSIVNPPAYTWAWAASKSGGAAVQIGGGPWNLEPEGAAFALSTDVPEAPSAVCLLIGIAGLWAFGKTRRSQLPKGPIPTT